MIGIKSKLEPDDSASPSPIIERVPHFGNTEKKRCYEILQEILVIEELQRNVASLCKMRRKKKPSVKIPMPKPIVEVKTDDSGVASSVISTREACSIRTSSTEPVNAILPENHIYKSFDFKDTYKGPFWEAPAIKCDGIYLVMVNCNKGETWARARFIKETGPICTVYLLQKQVTVKTFRQFFALDEQADMYLKIGQRVIAPIRQQADTGEMTGWSTYKLGTVTEYPAIENNYRYLIFFDSGQWFYINMEDVRPLMYQQNDAWKMVPEPHKFVLQMYLEGCFQPMVPFKNRQMVRFASKQVSEFKREYINTVYTVLNVDCSLVTLYDSTDCTSFLMHRGYPFLEIVDIC